VAVLIGALAPSSHQAQMNAASWAYPVRPEPFSTRGKQAERQDESRGDDSLGDSTHS
jgi:hypothetical protein